MNELLSFLNSHVSVRQFTDQPIDEDQERLIVTTAQRSPTSSNLQAYTIIGIRNQETKDRLAELCGRQGHIAHSGLFLLFCADLYRLSRLNAEKGYPFTGEYTEPFIVATVDTALAAGRALMAAQAMGLGGVMVGAIRNHPDDVAELLNLPPYTCPIMGMSLGYPATVPKVKPRLPMEAIYCREQYDSGPFAQAIADYDKIIDRLGHLKGREVNAGSYPDFAGDYSWSEHSARRMADLSPTALRPHMKSFLEKQKLKLK
ncbi:MAG: NADPH-dependent oxidoreductase [candidate division Zixibacteria bacterium]|nr:NADPH-dependent oxidoreductase [candidate division Zixibacteria bacterium]